MENVTDFELLRIFKGPMRFEQLTKFGRKRYQTKRKDVAYQRTIVSNQGVPRQLIKHGRSKSSLVGYKIF